MSLFDLQPITEEQVRANLETTDGGTIRKVVQRGPRRFVTVTLRHKPWWMLLGKGPEGKHCRECEFLTRNVSAKSYLKCGRQIITKGPGTDIRAKDEACRLFQEAQP